MLVAVPQWELIVNRLKILGYLFVLTGFWMIAPPMIVLAAMYLTYTKFMLFAPLLSLYIIWFCITYDWPERGCMPLNWMRKNAIFMTWGGDYFNYRIVKTADLPPDRNYVVGSHPHGMLSLALSTCFASNVSGVTDLYKGLSTWTVTLWGQFQWPLRREFLMCSGTGVASLRNLHFLLNQKDKGQAVGIVVGGLNEALMTQPGKYHLKIKDRKGFVRLALTQGADLVPMFHFGENEAFKPVYGICKKRMRNMLSHLMNSFGFVPPLFVGRSLFGFPWGGIAPFQVRMESVIGAPIRVEINPNPTPNEAYCMVEIAIDELHAVYCKKLVDLFETHKCNYGIPRNETIIMY